MITATMNTVVGKQMFLPEKLRLAVKKDNKQLQAAT